MKNRYTKLFLIFSLVSFIVTDSFGDNLSTFNYNSEEKDPSIDCKEEISSLQESVSEFTPNAHKLLHKMQEIKKSTRFDKIDYGDPANLHSIKSQLEYLRKLYDEINTLGEYLLDSCSLDINYRLKIENSLALIYTKKIIFDYNFKWVRNIIMDYQLGRKLGPQYAQALRKILHAKTDQEIDSALEYINNNHNNSHKLSDGTRHKSMAHYHHALGIAYAAIPNYSSYSYSKPNKKLADIHAKEGARRGNPYWMGITYDYLRTEGVPLTPQEEFSYFIFVMHHGVNGYSEALSDPRNYPTHFKDEIPLYEALERNSFFKDNEELKLIME